MKDGQEEKVKLAIACRSGGPNIKRLIDIRDPTNQPCANGCDGRESYAGREGMGGR